MTTTEAGLIMAILTAVLAMPLLAELKAHVSYFFVRRKQRRLTAQYIARRNVALREALR